MSNYLCELIDSKGIVQERFYRSGESAMDAKEGLECFVWREDCVWFVSDLGE